MDDLILELEGLPAEAVRQVLDRDEIPGVHTSGGFDDLRIHVRLGAVEEFLRVIDSRSYRLDPDLAREAEKIGRGVRQILRDDGQDQTEIESRHRRFYEAPPEEEEETPNTGGLGPSLTYDNPDEEGEDDYAPEPERTRGGKDGLVSAALIDDATEFKLNDCDRQEVPPEVQTEVENALESEVSRNPGRDKDDEILEHCLRIEGFVSPPGEDGTLPVAARYPETYEVEASGEKTLDEVFAERGWTVPEILEFPFHRAARIAANPREKLAAKASYKTEERLPMAEIYDRNRDGTLLTAQEVGVGYQQLFGTNQKLEKGEKYRYFPIGIQLSPSVMSGLADLCPFKSKGCFIGCLDDSGQSEAFEKKTTNDPSAYRKRRTMFLLNNHDLFGQVLDLGVKKAREVASEGAGFELCVRPNTLSDLPWENPKFCGFKLGSERRARTIIDRYRDVHFYDYTKNTKRMAAFLSGRGWPKNYHLTFSWSEINAAFAFWVLDQGGTVAVAFDTRGYQKRTPLHNFPLLPKWWCGYRIIDGDISDLRWIDKKFFCDYNRATGDLLESGRLTREDVREIRAEVKSGRGLVVGLRLKGRKFRKTVEDAQEIETGKKWAGPNGDVKFVSRDPDGVEFAPTECSGGLVQYSGDCGMDENDRTYDHSANKTMEETYKNELVAKSEQRRYAQFFEKYEMFYRGRREWARKHPNAAGMMQMRAFVGIALPQERMLKDEGRISETIAERRARGEPPTNSDTVCDEYLPPRSRWSERERARVSTSVKEILDRSTGDVPAAVQAEADEEEEP